MEFYLHDWIKMLVFPAYRQIRDRRDFSKKLNPATSHNTKYNNDRHIWSLGALIWSYRKCLHSLVLMCPGSVGLFWGIFFFLILLALINKEFVLLFKTITSKGRVTLSCVTAFPPRKKQQRDLSSTSLPFPWTPLEGIFCFSFDFFWTVPPLREISCWHL